MRYRWYRWWTLFTLPFLVAPFVVGGILFVEAYGGSPGRFMGVLPLFFFSLLGFYASLAYLFNSTELRVEDDLVTVRHGPVPWKGCAYRLVDCAQFFAENMPSGRMKFPAVRIRFHDDSYENLAYAGTIVQAESWALELNEHLLRYPPSIESETESRFEGSYLIVKTDR